MASKIRCLQPGHGAGLGWPAGFGEVMDGELGSGDSGLGEQSGRGRLVCGYCEGVAAADGRAVAPCCPGQVYGPGAVRADGTAVPLHRSAPAGPRLVEKALHAAFGVGFSLAGGARGGDLDEFVPGRGKGGVGETVAGGVDPVIQVHDPEPARAGVGPQAQVERCHAGAGPGKRSVAGQLARCGEAGGQDRRARGQGGYPCLDAYLRAEAGSSLGKKTDQGGPPAGHVPGAAGQRPAKALVGERGRKPPGVVVEGEDENHSDDCLSRLRVDVPDQPCAERFLCRRLGGQRGDGLAEFGWPRAEPASGPDEAGIARRLHDGRREAAALQPRPP